MNYQQYLRDKKNKQQEQFLYHLENSDSNYYQEKFFGSLRDGIRHDYYNFRDIFRGDIKGIEMNAPWVEYVKTEEFKNLESILKKENPKSKMLFDAMSKITIKVNFIDKISQPLKASKTTQLLSKLAIFYLDNVDNHWPLNVLQSEDLKLMVEATDLILANFGSATFAAVGVDAGKDAKEIPNQITGMVVQQGNTEWTIEFYRFGNWNVGLKKRILNNFLTLPKSDFDTSNGSKEFLKTPNGQKFLTEWKRQF